MNNTNKETEFFNEGGSLFVYTFLLLILIRIKRVAT